MSSYANLPHIYHSYHFGTLSYTTCSVLCNPCLGVISLLNCSGSALILCVCVCACVCVSSPDAGNACAALACLFNLAPAQKKSRERTQSCTISSPSVLCNHFNHNCIGLRLFISQIVQFSSFNRLQQNSYSMFSVMMCKH